MRFAWFQSIGFALVGATVWCGPAHSSSNACLPRAIVTAANVEASDGPGFSTQSFFQHADAAAIRHVYDDGAQTVAVEGPLAWIERGERARLGGAREQSFALGHQYHALLLHFEEIATGIVRSASVRFGASEHAARSGAYPYGGRIHLVEGEHATRPLGLLFELPEAPPMTARFEDWRSHGEDALPWRVVIDDGTRTFVYRYTSIERTDRTARWFFDALPAAPIEELRIHRLHRLMLAAHCMGDAALLAIRSAPETVVAAGGELATVTREATEAQFRSLFARLDYTHYSDEQAPVIAVSAAGDIGWIAVSVRAAGKAREQEAAFDDRWAWIMTVRQVNGEWLHAGNASNRKER